MKNKILSMLIAICVIVSAMCMPCVHAATYGNLTYTVSNGKVTITDCVASFAGNMTVPSKINGYPVTAIDSYAFYNCNALTGLTLPSGITSFGGGAFEKCTSLVSINIPSTVKIIGNYAFSNCTALKSISIPHGVTNIGTQAFLNCKALESISIPDSVISMGSEAFSYCTNLKTARVSAGLSTIATYAFSYCEKLETVTIPKGVTNIDTYAFARCAALKSIVLPASITNIGGAAFQNCPSLVSINIPGNVKIVGNNAFTNCFSLKNVSISEGVTTIGTDAFSHCEALETITLPDSLTTLGGSAFQYCIMLKNVKLSAGMTTVPKNAFSYCSSLENVTVPEGITTLMSYAFSYCTALETIDFPDSLASIGGGAFQGSTGLKSVDIPDKITVIANYAFSGCTGITEVTLPVSVTNVGSYAFNKCSSITDIYYAGSEEEWKLITIGSNNTYLQNATVHFGKLPIVSVTGINLSATYLSIERGKTSTITAEVLPADATDKTVVWTSADTSIATVSDGKITAIASGQTKITATTQDGGFTAICDVEVPPVSVEGIAFEKDYIEMHPGELETLKYTITPEDAANKAVKWSIDNPFSAYVDLNGVVTAVNPGTVKITIHTVDGDYSDTCTIKVIAINVTDLTINSDLNVEEGKSASITAKITPENATDKTIIWSSSDESIATVTDGVVTGISVGTTVIIAKTNDGNITKYCAVTVSPAIVPATGITLSNSSMSITEGYFATLAATVKPDDATNKNIIWTSNNTAIATVADGKVTAVAPGTAVIVATTEDGGYIATCIVTVSSANQAIVSAPVASISSGIVRENTNIILLSSTKNAVIYYTLDGTAPSTESNKYTAPIIITADTKIKAIAVKEGMQDSNIASFSYTLADSALPYINVVTNVTGNKGDVTTVSVNVSENSYMEGGSFNLVYDNTAVELVSVNAGNVISNANPIINDTYAENKIRVIWAGLREITAGGEIINAQFRILNDNKDVVYFGLEKVKLEDGNANKLSPQCSDGLLIINKSETTKEYITESIINSDNKSLCVKVSANSTRNAVLIAAEYDQYNKLIQLSHTDITNTDNTYTVNFEKAISSGADIRVFVWSSFGAMIPLSDVEDV